MRPSAGPSTNIRPWILKPDSSARKSTTCRDIFRTTHGSTTCRFWSTPRCRIRFRAPIWFLTSARASAAPTWFLILTNFGPSSGDYVTGSENDVVFAGQVFAGIAFRVEPTMLSLDLGYKYFATGDPTFTLSDRAPAILTSASRRPNALRFVRVRSLISDQTER